MSIAIIQLIDGLTTAEYIDTELDTDAMTEVEYLEWKELAMIEAGWETKRISTHELRTWKIYTEGPVKRKDRIFRIK